MTEAMASLRGKHVLLVEDEYFIAEEMTAEFEASEAVVIGPASNPRDALDLIEGDETIDGAVLDVNLQGELVYPVAAALERRGIPFVFVTGYDHSLIPDGFRNVPVCEKPMRPSRVRAALFG